MTITDLYRQLFGRSGTTKGSDIDMAEHGRVGGLSTGTGFKTVFTLSPTITELDYVSGTNPIYIGVAVANSATSAAVWQIKKLTYDGNDNPTSILAAGGTTEYNQVWDDRASLTYS